MSEHKHEFESDGGPCLICRKTYTQLLNETPPTNTEATGSGLTARAVREMSDDALRIRVAELCGWKQLRQYQNALGWRQTDWIRGATGEDAKVAYGNDMLPNYPADLNACHDTEKGLTDDQHTKFRYLLVDIARAQPNPSRAFASATARQRCEAFVLTLSPNGTTPKPQTEN